MTPNPAPLPELPAMQAPPSMAARPREEPSHSLARMPAPGAKRMRQVVGLLAGSGLALTLGVGALEMIAKPGLRPSDLLATMEAHVELGVMNQKMAAEPGVLKMTEADYQKALAKAQRDGQAEAELGYQKQLAVVQADKERVVGAYQTLFQRTNQIVAMALQMEQVAQQLRSALLQATNGGRSVVISIKDMLCGAGSAEACASAKADRRSMIEEADDLSRGDVGARVKELMADVPDPASFIISEDQKRNGMPALQR